MESFGSNLLKYLQQSERLIIVTLTITIAGLVCFFGERWQFFDFNGVPDWARPTALLVWTLSAVHVAIRTVLAASNGIIAVPRMAAEIPARQRRAAFERPLIQRLLATEGLDREMLCYALREEDSHIWVHNGSKARWLYRLKEAGLLQMTNGDFVTTHYHIHAIAWKYMQKHPNKFINFANWPEWPWTMTFDEDHVDKKIRNDQADPSRRAGSQKS
jgi:hypothetical protein